MRPQRLNKNSSEDELDQHIIKTVKENKPETVNQLVTLIKQKYQLPDQKILNHILTLQEKKQIHLTFPQTQPPQTLVASLTSIAAVATSIGAFGLYAYYRRRKP
jgi:hypothetical protein